MYKAKKKKPKTKQTKPKQNKQKDDNVTCFFPARIVLSCNTVGC
jgi:hypothetical protein